jgi:hypothetical protein
MATRFLHLPQWPKCISCLEGKSCLRTLQGKTRCLGSFPDAVSAAMCYDEAAKAAGIDAVLNFPSDSQIGLLLPRQAPELVCGDHQGKAVVLKDASL